jgi:hypothetical protein
MKLKKLNNHYYLLSDDNFKLPKDGLCYYDGNGNIRVTGTGNCYSILSKNIIAATTKLDDLPLLDKERVEYLLNDVLKSAVESYESTKTPKGENTGEVFIDGFKKGYNKNTNKFTIDDLKNLLLDYIEFEHPRDEPRGITIDRFIQEIGSGFWYKPKTEWDVEVEMEDCGTEDEGRIGTREGYNAQQGTFIMGTRIKVDKGYINISEIKK